MSRLFINVIPPYVQESEVRARQSVDDLLASVLLALRVFKAGRVRATGAFH